MSEKPILFNTAMVRAILDGRKTQTRRVIKPAPFDITFENREPQYHIGDTLYVRETWKQYTTGTAGHGLIDGYLYKADEPQDTTGMMVEGHWHPSIHMPRSAARIFLRVTNVRCEQVQDITNADAKSEGVMCATDNSGIMHRFNFRFLWDSITDESTNWNANPWVWVYEFERIKL